MQKYGISVREILERVIVVDAESVEEAIQKVESAVEREEIILDVDDYNGREIIPSECWIDGKIPDGEDISNYWSLDEGEII